MNLSSVTLVGMDGSGNRPNIIKAMRHSMSHFSFESCVLFSPVSKWSLYEKDNKIRLQDIRKLTYKEWNEFVIKELYNHIHTKHYLFVDTDGFVLNPDKWDFTFLDYDYIGAKWSLGQDTIYKNRFGIDCNNTVGNGGFTLRSKRLLKEASRLDYNGDPPEDAFLCIKNYDTLVKKGIRFAPPEVADKFSTDPYNGESFGFHGDKTIITKL